MHCFPPDSYLWYNYESNQILFKLYLIRKGWKYCAVSQQGISQFSAYIWGWQQTRLVTVHALLLQYCCYKRGKSTKAKSFFTWNPSWLYSTKSKTFFEHGSSSQTMKITFLSEDIMMIHHERQVFNWLHLPFSCDCHWWWIPTFRCSKFILWNESTDNSTESNKYKKAREENCS